MKFKIRELENQYKSGETSHSAIAIKNRHDIIEEIYGIRPVTKFTHESEKPINYIESDIVYLEGEKFV